MPIRINTPQVMEEKNNRTTRSVAGLSGSACTGIRINASVPNINATQNAEVVESQ